MAYAFNPFGVANVAVSVLLLALALLFLKARRSEFTLAFATYSALAAGQKFTGGVGLYFATDEATRNAWLLVSTLFLLLSTPTLAHALAAFTWPRRLERVPRRWKAALYLPFALPVPLVLTDPGAFQILGLPFLAIFLALMAVFLVPVGRRAFQPAPSATRTQSRYMLAYLLIALSFSVEARVILALFGRFPWWEVSLAYMVATGLLLYGILRTQLFDVQLKVKFAVRQSTIAAVFIGVFFVVSESASQFFSDEGGLGPYFGIAAAGLLVFALAPLQRAAEKVADAAMPGVANSQEYLSFRKLQVYRSALELATEDGVITDHERRVLKSLRADLDIADSDAQALEADLLRHRA